MDENERMGGTCIWTYFSTFKPCFGELGRDRKVVGPTCLKMRPNEACENEPVGPIYYVSTSLSSSYDHILSEWPRVPSGR